MLESNYMNAANKLNLFFVNGSSGVVFWKQNGYQLYKNLKNFIQKKHLDNNYFEVKTPSIVSLDVFKQSGHLDKYNENMFLLDDYALRPMSCPNHIEVFKSEIRSFKDLPFKIFEFGDVYRKESSGSLQILFRQKQFCQDDSHIFVNEDNILKVLSEYLLITRDVYNDLGFNHIEYDISLRPKNRFGSDDLWDKAEAFLRKACELNNIKYKELPNEGAFYGPKIELKIKDKLNRYWQLGVIQLDYVLPQRFNLSYINEKGEKSVPIILHHAVLGSLERMIGILLEVFGVNLPNFIHPIPNVVLSVSEKSFEYGMFLAEKNKFLFDSTNETLNKKIKKWKSMGVENIYVVGEKEMNKFKNEQICEAVLTKNNVKQVINFM